MITPYIFKASPVSTMQKLLTSVYNKYNDTIPLKAGMMQYFNNSTSISTDSKGRHITGIQGCFSARMNTSVTPDLMNTYGVVRLLNIPSSSSTNIVPIDGWCYVAIEYAYSFDTSIGTISDPNAWVERPSCGVYLCKNYGTTKPTGTIYIYQTDSATDTYYEYRGTLVKPNSAPDYWDNESVYTKELPDKCYNATRNSFNLKNYPIVDVDTFKQYQIMHASGAGFSGLTQAPTSFILQNGDEYTVFIGMTNTYSYYPLGATIGDVDDTISLGSSLAFCSCPKFLVTDIEQLDDYTKDGKIPIEQRFDTKTIFGLWISGLHLPAFKVNWHNDYENNPDFNASDYTVTIRSEDWLEKPFIAEVPYSAGSYEFNSNDIGIGSDVLGFGTTLYCSVNYKTVNSGEPSIVLHANKSSFAEMYQNITTASDGSTFVVHQGEPDPDDDYNDPDDDDEPDVPAGTIETSGALTTCFSMSKLSLNALSNFIWNGSFMDDILLANNNPIENIVSCKALPFSIGGTNKEIVLGNVTTGVFGNECSECYTYDIGSIVVPRKHNNFLDYAPYTGVSIYLPFIGVQTLDTNVVMGRTISVKYIVDCITGSLKVKILRGDLSKTLYEFNGNIGVDVPITSSNRAQVEMGYLASLTGMAVGIASGNVGMTIGSGLAGVHSQYHSTTNGSASPSTNFHDNRTCFIIIDYPTYDNITSFNSTVGRMCNLGLTLKNLSGFTVVNENIRLNNIDATENEKEELRRILSTGFII